MINIQNIIYNKFENTFFKLIFKKTNIYISSNPLVGECKYRILILKYSSSLYFGRHIRYDQHKSITTSTEYLIYL